MKQALTAFIALTVALVTSCDQQNSKKTENKNTTDTLLIKELKADEYGMRHYVMAFLKKGPNRNQDSATAEKLQSAHMANIKRMADEGKLCVAGPFMDDTDIRGIYIFNVGTIEEAKKLTESDPAIQAGRLIMELHPWYGSAALMKVTEIHKKLQTKHF